MTRADAARVADHCRSEGYEYRERWDDPPLSGVLFRSRAHVRLRDVVDARTRAVPFLLGRAQARGWGRREVAVIVLPLRRPVPNMILSGRRKSVLPGLGVALREDQRLRLEGDFDSRFSLYCPREYETDALYVFAPDVMARMLDADGVCDVEFVDDRILLYAPMPAFYAPGRLARAEALVDFLHEKLDNQTRLYHDLDRVDGADSDPFRRAQLTSAESDAFAIGESGHRIRTRTTVWQKAGIAIAALAAFSAAAYWLTMITRAFAG